MKIKWLGHANFLIQTEDIKIICDPFDESLGYPVPQLKADIVTVSHEHFDHNAVQLVEGQPQVIKDVGEFIINNVEIKGITSYHDKNMGKQRGTNTIYSIHAEGLKLVHLGDLGHILQVGQLREIGTVDILLLPVGGVYTIDASEALQVADQLNPKIVIPMHYDTPHLSLNLAPVESFIQNFDRVIKVPYLEVNTNNIDDQPKVILLDYLS